MGRALTKAEKALAPAELHADPVFFHVSQIKVGTILRHYGRLAPNTRWRVSRIVTWNCKRGIFRQRNTDHCEHLSDEVTLQCVSGGKPETRFATFQYLSYSAIWRL